jgi:hypothetical protein
MSALCEELIVRTAVLAALTSVVLGLTANVG